MELKGRDGFRFFLSQTMLRVQEAQSNERRFFFRFLLFQGSGSLVTGRSEGERVTRAAQGKKKQEKHERIRFPLEESLKRGDANSKSR